MWWREIKLQKPQKKQRMLHFIGIWPEVPVEGLRRIFGVCTGRQEKTKRHKKTTAYAPLHIPVMQTWKDFRKQVTASWIKGYIYFLFIYFVLTSYSDISGSIFFSDTSLNVHLFSYIGKQLLLPLLCYGNTRNCKTNVLSQSIFC